MQSKNSWTQTCFNPCSTLSSQLLLHWSMHELELGYSTRYRSMKLQTTGRETYSCRFPNLYLSFYQTPHVLIWIEEPYQWAFQSLICTVLDKGEHLGNNKLIPILRSWQWGLGSTLHCSLAIQTTTNDTSVHHWLNLKLQTWLTSKHDPHPSHLHWNVSNTTQTNKEWKSACEPTFLHCDAVQWSVEHSSEHQATQGPSPHLHMQSAMFHKKTNGRTFWATNLLFFCWKLLGLVPGGAPFSQLNRGVKDTMSATTKRDV